MAGILLLVVSFIFIHVNNQNRILKQKQQLQAIEIAHQKQLLYAVIQSQEKERERIGRDLHDDVGTALSNLRITIEHFVQKQLNEESLTGFKKSSKLIIDKIITDVRNISHALSPSVLNLYGFKEGIEELCDIINGSQTVSITITDDTTTVLEKLSPMAAVSLYRVMEELLTNTVKHAGATTVRILLLEKENCLVISYTDDGRGLPSSAMIKKGMGLHNIESRLEMIKAEYVLTPVDKGFAMQIKYDTVQ